MQFLAEHLLFVGEHDAGLAWIERSIQAGLQDYIWMERCPMLAPLRDRPRFRELTAALAQRAATVLASVHAARA